ncbi:MAG: DUF4242 domain-containing protein [Chloroflexi bacterium]|nr:DUF4242 domain-containing protein [Chloroflexota bacterium]
MPMYLDHHKGTLSPQMAEEARKVIRAGMASPQGVKGLNAFFTKDESWCLTEAPSAEAVHKYHEAMGMKLGKGDVIEVKTLV